MLKRITRIGIIEDNEYLLNNYNDYFDLQEDYKVSFAFKNLMTFESRNRENTVFTDIILLDVGLPQISGIDAIPILRKYYPAAIIVMLTACKDTENIIKSAQNGALGYLLKGMPLNEIKSSLEAYKSGGAAISPYVVKKMFEHINQVHEKKNKVLDALTPREKDVAKCLIEGLSYKGSAQRLGLKVTTINQHLKNIYIKFNINSKSELISIILKDSL